MSSPRFDRRRGYSPVAWIALVALVPASVYLGIHVRLVFLLPGLFAFLALGLGVAKRRRGG